MDLSSFDEDFLDYKLVGNITLFINCIICLSYPLNFAIYCGMSRSELRVMMMMMMMMMMSSVSQLTLTL